MTTTILSAHPVDAAIGAEIIEKLAQIERQHQVSILFACESGSRGWGFASPDSDYDVRFIYVPRLSWYLCVRAGRDVIEEPINDLLDISGWELRKALGLLYAANPTLVEWLDSPIIYREASPWGSRLRALVVQYFSPLRGYHHYISMAKRNFHGHLSDQSVRYKKYFYVLRPLLAARWIRERGSVPPMRFSALASQMLANEPAVIDDINALLEIKMRAGESATSPRWPGLHAFIERELAIATGYTPPPVEHHDITPLDDFLGEAILGVPQANT